MHILPVCYSLLIVLVSRSLCQVPYDSYSCGVDGISKFLSLVSSIPCDQYGLHMCCMEHDFCYSSCTIPQAQCDASFCGCLATLSADWYCRNMVYLAHCNLVTWFGGPFMCDGNRPGPASSASAPINGQNGNSIIQPASQSSSQFQSIPEGTFAGLYISSKL
ncbi:hypothetical protein WR25_22827 [Diploscapter pachys]|uniref:Domain of unknown function DB domain-containing protein n=1 Tax=Diploscapter pachys TaxID=2018661 RepID=A0A2A2KX94_9BILA|nr:hypothetical protein WR25_22827 [Diploscapter pachys]